MDLLTIARRPAVTVTPDESVMTAVEKMKDIHVGAVAVVDADRLVGIFTERDLMEKVVYARLSALDTRVCEVMTPDPHAIHPGEMGPSEAFAYMSTEHLRHLPLVDENSRLEGMLSVRHLMRVIVDLLNKELAMLNSYINADWVHAPPD